MICNNETPSYSHFLEIWSTFAETVGLLTCRYMLGGGGTATRNMDELNVLEKHLEVLIHRIRTTKVCRHFITKTSV